MKMYVYNGVYLFFCFGLLFFGKNGFGQKKTNPDSIALQQSLSEVSVTAFEITGKPSDRPAALSFIDTKVLDRYSSENIVSAMNSIPGLRMEQRSPGSYRVNIRGSSLRSPFGVRNVKVYYNGIPFTDPGGNTYLNQLALEDIHSMTVIRGPAGSMYGAGTGGALLINSPLHAADFQSQKGVSAGWGIGSFGAMKEQVALNWGEGSNRNSLRYSNAESEGYRDHTALHHQSFAYEMQTKPDEHRSIEAFFRYVNLYYQTPGALTQTQFEENPRASRPAAGPVPSAEESDASVHQKSFLAGLKHTYELNKKLKNTTTLYGAYTDFVNPTFLNYEYRKEPHFGGRTVFEYSPEGTKTKSRFFLGAEGQQGHFSQQDFENVHGSPDSLLTFDRVNEMTGFLFGQADFIFQKGWEFNAGASLNLRQLHFERLIPSHEADFTFKNKPVFAPRITLSKKIRPNLLIFADVSRGFSPPTVAEILPSTAELNRDLKAEKGMQYEIGSKGYFFDHRLFYDVDFFISQLNESITSRKSLEGADFFVNAGKSLQKGMESALTYVLHQNRRSFLQKWNIWGSLTLFDFKYRNFQAEDKDFSGKYFPGSAKTTVAAGMDGETRIGLTAHLTYQYTSKIPLNDANTVYTVPYHLLGFNLSYEKDFSSKIGMRVSVGGDNLLNQRYSLGDDLNAFGDRYYNLASGINFYGKIEIMHYFRPRP